MKNRFLLLALLLLGKASLQAQSFVSNKMDGDAFTLVSSTQAASILIDENDDWLVRKAASLLQQDIEMVSGKKPMLEGPAKGNSVIIIGSLHGSSIIRQLSEAHKINTNQLDGKWEAFSLQTVNNPLPGIARALVITGSDKRGTAYGVFELSKQMGVSPWYWWADVPAKKSNQLYIKAGNYFFNSPSVKYRGIFINDEAPAFSGWTKEKFGGVNHLVYEKMFELLLRLKANYLWPAMWGNAFNDDDTLNPVLADKWGIVMGSTHHEPMLRAQQEWKRYGKGPWNYATNDTVLNAFWKKGIENMGKHESIVSIGMRGDGDMPMTQGTAVSLLENIVANQRKIIEEVTGKPASQTPQLWALYKEVQDYYDKGMRVPDDVTLLLCDDNWGNIRRLPKTTDKPRAGGYGIYYHFDYVGGPRNYKWINTNNIARVWEQMHLAYEYDVRQIWIVNVGDLKPMELPISFFLDYAWDTHKWNESNINQYYRQWAGAQFGPGQADGIASLLSRYAEYISRRKPEMLDSHTYSLENYRELDRVNEEWKKLLADAQTLNQKIAADSKDAFFELVLHPIMAASNLQFLYTAVAWNNFYAQSNNPLANKFADQAKELYTNDSLITLQYHQLAGGKWNHMMDQKHIGYTYWQEPRAQKMPDVKYVTADVAGPATPYSYVSNIASGTAASLLPAVRPDNSFSEVDGYVSIPSTYPTKTSAANGIGWRTITGIGRDGDGISSFPVTAPAQKPAPGSPRLSYEFYCYDTGFCKINTYFSPTLNIHNDPDGLQYAISIDDEAPQFISVNKDDNDGKQWNQWVGNNVIIKTSEHKVARQGKHTLHYWLVSPALVLQKLVIDFGGEKKSYLGPPSTRITNKKNKQ